MSQIDWTDVLDIGLPTIDEQHKELIGLSNSLIQAMINGMGSDVLEETVAELCEYTRSHFADEEAYMAEIDYPGLAEQKAAHAKLAAEVDQLKQRIVAGEQMSPNDMLDFINNWIVTHIMEMDSQIGIFAKAR